MFPTIIGLMFAAKHVVICLYLTHVSSTSFRDVMCLVGHTFTDGTNSIMVCG